MWQVLLEIATMAAQYTPAQQKLAPGKTLELNGQGAMFCESNNTKKFRYVSAFAFNRAAGLTFAV